MKTKPTLSDSNLQPSAFSLATRAFCLPRVALCLLPLAFSLQPSAFGQGTAFTYQGRLNNNGSAASGSYDFRFRLASDALGNNYVGGPVLSNALPVSGGLFTVTLDFGAGVFTGSNYWLEVDVKTNGAGGYTALAPLQSLTPSPYAIFAGTAGNISGILPSGQLAGAYSSAVSFNNAANSFTGGFNGNGSNLANVNAAALSGLGANQFWKTGGNSNTVAGANFLGTADSQPLELSVNRQRALRLEPNTNGAPNVIGGAPNNFVDPGVIGATIAGGGAANYSDAVSVFNASNHVSARFGTISGGRANTVNTSYSAIGGGGANLIQSNAPFSAVVGGSFNTIQAGSYQSIIGGGYLNTIQTNAYLSTIGGGYINTIQSNATYATIGGGSVNVSGDRATVGGGEYNTSSGFDATVGGGYGNTSSGTRATVGGGVVNSALGSAATVAGGYANTSSGEYATVAGGQNNTSGAFYSTIGGGYVNTNNAYGSIIGGGQQNFIGDSTTLASIGGGWLNKILTNAFFATIGGGYFNIAGGLAATAPGGYLNSANGSYSFAAGQQASANHDGAFVWADSQDAPFSSTATNQFSVRANGGVRLETAGAGVTLDGQALLTADALSNVALRTGGNAFSGQQTVTGGNVGIGAVSPQRTLQVGDSGVPGSEGMIHLGSRSPSGTSLRDWELGVPQTGDFVNGEGYSFVIRDATAGPGSGTRLMIQWGTGNVGIGTSAPGYLLQVGSAYCDGNTWAPSSDRHVKSGFEPVDARAILEKLAALPITRWHYTNDPTTPHLGPVAQDFQALFGIGADDKHIADVDEGGVALAAIQGLNQKLEGRSKELQACSLKLEAENAELKARLERLEHLLNARNGGGK